MNRKLETWVQISSFVTCILCSYGNFHAFIGSVFPSVKWGVTSEIHRSYTYSALWKCLWSLKKCYPYIKDEGIQIRKILIKKKNFYPFIRLCLFVLCVCTYMLFGLLFGAVCDPTTTACSVSDYLVVESKFSGQIFMNWTVIKWNAHVCSNMLCFCALQNTYQISIGNRLKLSVFR